MSARDDKRAAMTAFYQHKREEHGGSYVRACGHCERLYAAYVEASRREAGLAPAY